MNRDPNRMTTEERDAEVSRLLAKGLLRMHKDAKRLLGSQTRKSYTASLGIEPHEKRPSHAGKAANAD